MTTTTDEAIEAARTAATGGPDRLLERLAGLVGARASVEAVFGEPIRQGDLTVVPVARVRWGFGGGGGRSEAPQGGPAAGSGGGGGVTADPIGYLEIGPAGTAYRPITAGTPSPAFVLASGIAAALIVRAIARLVRG